MTKIKEEIIEALEDGKKWMVASKGKNHILLHHNEELEQYKKLPRVPSWIIKLIKKKKVANG